MRFCQRRGYYVFVLAGSLFAASHPASAASPASYTHWTRYTEEDGSYTYWRGGSETYVKSTLPNEWLYSWPAEALEAGAVIIRSGVFWRINRSVLDSRGSNNNCWDYRYRGDPNGPVFYVTAPNTRGGREEWRPNSGSDKPKTNAAVDATLDYHAERILFSGRPDPFVSLRYIDVQQHRTNAVSGDWLTRIRYAYTGTGASGRPFDPNEECSQVDDQTPTDPIYTTGPNVCTAFSTGNEVVTNAACVGSVTVSLSVESLSGSAPLNDIDLTATVGGTSTGTINYTFYCDRADGGIDITPNPDAKFDGINTNPKTVANLCDYSEPRTYTAKVVAERGAGAAEARKTIVVTSSGSSAPAVTTLAATSVTQQSATFNATVHPKNSTTTFWFDYGTTTSVNQSTSTQTLAAATSPSAVSISQGGLVCGQQYFYRIRASNAGGLAPPGSILSFTTDACGSGGSGDVQLVADPSFEAGNNAWWVADPAFYIKGGANFPNPRTGSRYAFLSNLDGSRGNNLSGGVISPSVTIPANAEDVDLRFYYSITSDETTSTLKNDRFEAYLVRPGNQLTLITTLSNLDENGTSYSLRSTDISSSFYGDTVQIFFAGFTNGSQPTVFRIDDVTLEVDVPSASAPAVDTEAADQVSASAARLNMTVNPHGASTEVWFDLEANDSTPNDDTEHISVGSGSQTKSISIPVFGLECATLYYYRARASNSVGSDSGSVRSFTTSPCAGGAPEADTDPAKNITQTSATLTADVNPNGLSTQAWFEWGTTPNPTQETPHIFAGGGTGFVDFEQTITGLSCGTTYYFENHASNSAGQDDGATLEFVTAQCSDEAPGGGGCGRILVNQARDPVGGCDASDAGIQWSVAENFRLTDRRDVSCLEVLGYYWPNNDPPQSSVFDVVFYEVASNGAPGAVVREDRGVRVLRQKTGKVLVGMEEWRFALELTTPVELAAGSYFVEVTGAAETGGSFCWSSGQIDEAAGLDGLAFRNTGQWSLGDWSLAFKVFERSASEASDFYTVTPCRVVDTRNPTGAFGGPALSSGNLRNFALAGRCGIPVGANAVAINVTVVNAGGGDGYLTLFPSDHMLPGTSSINFRAGQTRANNSVMKLSSTGALSVWPVVGGNGQVHFTLDVVGYFAPGN